MVLQIMNQGTVISVFALTTVSHYVVDYLIIAGGILGVLGLVYGACAAWNKPSQIILRRLLVSLATGALGLLYALALIVISPTHILRFTITLDGVLSNLIGVMIIVISAFILGWMYTFTKYQTSLSYYWISYVSFVIYIIFIIIWQQAPIPQAILLGSSYWLGFVGCIRLSTVALKFSDTRLIIISVGFGVLSIMFSALLFPVLDLLNVRFV